MSRSLGRFGALLLLTLALVACGSRGHERPPAPQADAPPHRYEPLDGPPNVPFDVDALPELVPRDEPLARYGNHSPYEVLGHRYKVLSRSAGYVERGTASWYGTKFHGRLTSTREPYDMYQFSAAHKTLPLPSYVRVTNLENGKSVVVRVNDRGPFHENRLIDLSYAAAVRIGVWPKGTGMVEVRLLDGSSPEPKPLRAVPAADSHSRVFVQLGAFADQGNADRIVQRIARTGLGRADIVTTRIDSRAIHRVRIGPLDSVEAADALVVRLEKLGFGMPRVAIED